MHLRNVQISSASQGLYMGHENNNTETPQSTAQARHNSFHLNLMRQ